jgi:DNA-binding NarL/FixJ family response regulator
MAPERLSPRERSVVRLIAEGNTNQEIAKLLNRSIKTVEANRLTALAKIGAHSAADSVRYVLKHKLSDV